MPSEHDWPAVDTLLDHWTSYRPDWTGGRERLLWYLTFEERPEVAARAAAAEEALGACALDVVPARWLHLTLADVGFVDTVDPTAFRAAGADVRRELARRPQVHLSLGPIALMEDSVVLVAQPYDDVVRLRDVVREAGEAHGLPLADAEEAFRPHVTLGYANTATDQDRLAALVAGEQLPPVEVTCDRLRQVQVTRGEGHYRWHTMSDLPLGAYRYAG
ncbi:2'-5' RNA ligase family protein [Nocardioides caldifontis]|uniref:2'-5' RNA ligase family protein n=1 Tax=Nocardioides caldifontis TaxID=2588938 RepID=UPI0011E023E6|nr:2'-5' RNA ligase family protein [Nocardioides caldifontis]